jgi:hypothetical protein
MTASSSSIHERVVDARTGAFGATLFPNVLAWAFRLSLVVLFAGGFWFRVTSLKTGPVPTGDEAVYGVLGIRLLQGLSVRMWTPSGHLMSPVLVAMEMPLLSVFEPSYTALRLPIAVAGILTVVLGYRLFARVLDRPTGLIAAGLLAVLPIAIIYSRLAWEPGLIPLWSALLTWQAFRDRRLAMLATLLFGVLFVHPTLIMIAPILTSVQMARTLSDQERSWAERRRSALISAGLMAAVVIPVLIFCRDGQAAAWTRATYHFGPPDIGQFLMLYKNMLLGYCAGVSTETGRALDVAFWCVVLGVLIPGSWRLASQRRWDRLALVASVIASLVGLNLVEGPGVLHPGLVRYAMFLVVPSALAFACLARSLLVEPSTLHLAAVRNVQAATLLVLGFALLVGMKHHWFDAFIAQGRGRERLWTLRSEAIEQKHRITRIVLTDMAATAHGGTRRPAPVILADDHWSYQPIQFFTAWRRDVKVVNLEPIGEPALSRFVRDRLKAGAYVVGIRSQPVDRVVQSCFAPGELREWVVQSNYDPIYAVYRIARPEERIARR